METKVLHFILPIRGKFSPLQLNMHFPFLYFTIGIADGSRWARIRTQI